MKMEKTVQGLYTSMLKLIYSHSFSAVLCNSFIYRTIFIILFVSKSININIIKKHTILHKFYDIYCLPVQRYTDDAKRGHNSL